jgi:hypothetical protein
VIFSSLLLHSCTVSDFSIPKSILGQVTFVLNGKNYVMQGRGVLLTNASTNSVFITATNTQKETISLNISNFDSSNPYKLQENTVIGFASNGITQASNLCTQTTPITTNTKIQFSEFDKKNKIVAGYFEGTICTMQNSTQNTAITISNGNFKVEFD